MAEPTDLIGPREAAAILKCSRQHVCRLARAGAIPTASRPGGWQWLFSRAEVERMAQGGKR